jgi:rod shape-determining protein MreC
MKINTEEKKQRNEMIVYVSALLALFFLLLDGIWGFNVVRDAIAFVVQPAVYSANSAGGAVKSYLETFTQLGKFRKEYDELKAQIYSTESKYAEYMVLVNENEALKKQILVKDGSSEYVMASVLRDDAFGTMLIDKGSEDGIQEGDVVSVGNTFIGLITRADPKGSLVSLPVDPNSHFEVVVLKYGPNTSTNILSKGVVSGSAEGILVENISMNSDVQNGDVVYINDSKVGGFLALGYVVGLSNNPAKTYKTAYVSPVLDYDTLMNVFIKIN